MTADEYQTIETHGGCVDLSARAKFRLTGADRVRYLNGQVTNDVRKATSTSAVRACVTNAKGRIEAEVFIHATPDGEALLLDAEPGLREALAMRLERYIVADDVTLEDVTEEWRVRHRFPGTEPSEAGGLAGGGAIVQCERFGVVGADLWVPAGASLPCPSSTVLSSDDAEALRILRGIPRWPGELNSETFPQEAGLEAAVMDFTKGCYIGQEVLSRIKTTGKMPRVLRKFSISSPDHPVEVGMKLFSGEDLATAKEAGILTSVMRHPGLDRVVGLAYVRQTFEGVHSLLLACEEPPRLLGDVEISTP